MGGGGGSLRWLTRAAATQEARLTRRQYEDAMRLARRISLAAATGARAVASRISFLGYRPAVRCWGTSPSFHNFTTLSITPGNSRSMQPFGWTFSNTLLP